MTILEFSVRKKDFSAAQEVLSRIHPDDAILVSQYRGTAVYRILIETDRMPSIITELNRSIKSFSLCAVSKTEDDFLPVGAASCPKKVHAFRALPPTTKDGDLTMRRMFGFKVLDE